MRIEELKVGYHYYITDFHHHVFDGCTTQVYTKEYHKIKKDSFELIGMGGEYPTEGEVGESNNVKMLHEKTGIIIYTHCSFLSKINPCELHNNFWEWEYKYNSYCNNQALSSNSIATKYDYGRRTAFNVAKEKEFKLERIDNKQKARLTIAKLEILIDKTLEDINDVNGRKFFKYTKWLSLIKNKYGELV